ncbi:hypothetical protein Smp_176740 [Schistosoma mansoni]|uniref:Uncharacterized protein n=1 Tax=Schistosoma mansoni TaxID=6183 RepID=G4VLP7_SCHMA|nr:hypothetical protein Smp_176740 [Schistosoma mansoni]|eukprot:XP_018653001.1 hypothetical protein Smp_176740 [Schistosoma mansoni]
MSMIDISDDDDVSNDKQIEVEKEEGKVTKQIDNTTIMLFFSNFI